MKLNYIVSKTDENKKIKDILISKLHISHRLLITLKNKNTVYLNNNKIELYKPVKENDIVTIDFDYEEDNSNIIPKEIPLDIVYEDEWLLVVNKPPFIPVHPSILHYEDSLSSGIKYYFDTIGLKKKIRPVNRIDKDTSGLVIFAKCEYVQEELIRQMKNNTFKKEYIGIIEGSLKNKQSTINLPIARKENSIIERCIDESGDKSITHYEVIKEFEKYSIVKFILETGRTHQIRVHTSYLGYPLLGDTLYGKESNLINRQALHCYKMSFIHPITDNEIIFEANLPDDMKNLYINQN